MTESLQVAFVVEDGGWEDGVESAEQGDHCEIGCAECMATSTKEEHADCHMGCHVTAIRRIRIDPTMK
jgi:hypothetical protein